VCVVVTRYGNGETKLEQRCAIKFCVNLMKSQQKLTKNLKGLMESMLYQGHRFLDGLKYFRMAVRAWKTNLVLEDLARQKRTKI